MVQNPKAEHWNKETQHKPLSSPILKPNPKKQIEQEATRGPQIAVPIKGKRTNPERKNYQSCSWSCKSRQLSVGHTSSCPCRCTTPLQSIRTTRRSYFILLLSTALRERAAPTKAKWMQTKKYGGKLVKRGHMKRTNQTCVWTCHDSCSTGYRIYPNTLVN